MRKRTTRTVFVGLLVVGLFGSAMIAVAPSASQETARDTEPDLSPVIPPSADPLINCPRNESFEGRTDNARGCNDRNGQLRCFSKRHFPCAGVHSQGFVSYQEVRRGQCIKIRRKAVRCEGAFEHLGACGQRSTVECGQGGRTSPWDLGRAGSGPQRGAGGSPCRSRSGPRRRRPCGS